MRLLFLARTIFYLFCTTRCQVNVDDGLKVCLCYDVTAASLTCLMGAATTILIAAYEDGDGDDSEAAKDLD